MTQEIKTSKFGLMALSTKEKMPKYPFLIVYLKVEMLFGKGFVFMMDESLVWMNI